MTNKYHRKIISQATKHLPWVPSLPNNHPHAFPGNDVTSFLVDTSVHSQKTNHQNHQYEMEKARAEKLYYLSTFITNSKYPMSESKVVGVYGLTTSSPWLSLPLIDWAWSKKPNVYLAISSRHRWEQRPKTTGMWE